MAWETPKTPLVVSCTLDQKATPFVFRSLSVARYVPPATETFPVKLRSSRRQVPLAELALVSI